MNSFFLAWFFDFDGLEATLKSGILFNIFAILIERGRAHTLQFTSTKRGLDNVGSIHRAFSGTGSDNRMQLVDKQNHVLTAPDFVHDSFDALFKLPTVFRPRHHERQVESDHFFIAQNFGHIARSNLLRQTFDNGCLAHARFTKQHRIILSAAAQHLDDAFDLSSSANHRVQLTFFSQLCQITSESTQRGSLHFLFASTRLSFIAAAFVLAFRPAEIRVQLAENLVACTFDIDVERLQHAGSHAFTFAQQAQQEMLGAHVGMIEHLGFFTRQGEHFFHSRRVRDIAHHLRFRTRAHLFLHFHAHGFEVEPHLLQHIDRNSLPELDQAQKQMLGAHIVVVEPVRFLASKSENLLSAWRKIIHFFDRYLVCPIARCLVWASSLTSTG